ncbi:MAG: class II aldolase/adducin family protein [bacterium]
MEHAILREQVVEAARRMAACGLVVGTAGNVSARVPGQEVFVITPSSLAYSEMTAADTVIVDLAGKVLTRGRPPSTETIVHRRIYAARAGVGAICHSHSRHATALAILRMPIPAVLEELVPYVGGPVEVAEYAPSASRELAENVIRGLADRAAVLLANHGALSVGRDLAEALHVAELIEQAAQIYILARSIGTPCELPRESLELYRMVYAASRSKE